MEGGRAKSGSRRRKVRRLGIARPSPTPCRVCSRLCVFRNHPHKRGAAPESGAAGCCPAPAQQPPSRGGCCPAAGQQPPRSPRSNRPPEAGAALRSRGIRPPELQEPLPWQEPFAAHRRLRRLLPREPLRELRATGGCCCGSRAAPASGGRPSAQLLPREGGFCPAPASGRRLLPREGGFCLGRTLKLGRGNRVAASVRSLARNRLPRQEPPAGAARAPQHPFGLEAAAAPPHMRCDNEGSHTQSQTRRSVITTRVTFPQMLGLSCRLLEMPRTDWDHP